MLKTNPMLGVKPLSAAIALVVGVSGAQAQMVLEEVVVTAQKREQDLQTVPVAITAFSGDQMKNLGFQNQTDIISQSPNVTLNDFGTGPSIRIRGIGADTFSETIESSAATYRDEVYRPTMAANNGQIFDQERVEVLRGPQGTLYGRNTNGGLIHFYSQRPGDELNGYAELQLGNYGQQIFEGAVGGPFSDWARGRFSVKRNKDDGYQENLGSGGGDDFGKTDITAFRAQLEFDITDDVLLRLIGSRTKQRSKSQIYAFRGMVDPLGNPCGASQVQDGDCYAFAPTPSGLFRVDKDDAEKGYSERPELENKLDSHDAAAILSWQFTDTLELVSVTSYETIKRLYQEDVDASDGGLFDGTGFLQGAADYNFEATTKSQEFRLVGTHERVNWVGGIYLFSDNKKDVHNEVPDFGIDVTANVKTGSTAAFGQVDFNLTDNLILTGGLRYTIDKRDAEVSTPMGGFFGGSTYEEYETNERNWTYRLGLQWDINDDLMFYTTYSTGIKSGEFNVNLITTADEAAPVGEEKVQSFEIGSKWSFLNGRGRLNSALFYNAVEDYQATVYESTGAATPTSLFRNIGDVDIYGAEFELAVNPVTNLDIVLGIALLDTKVKSDTFLRLGPAVPPTFASGTVYPVDGNELVQAPKVAANGLIRYGIPTERAGEFALQMEFTWQDEVYLDVANDPYNVQDAYGLFNFRFFWESPESRFYTQLFVENATNEFYASEAFTPEFFDRQGVIFGKPRTYGAKFGVRF